MCLSAAQCNLNRKYLDIRYVLCNIYVWAVEVSVLHQDIRNEIRSGCVMSRVTLLLVN